MPKQRGEEKSRRDAAIVAYTLIRFGERELDEALSERLFEDDVDQRQQAVRQPVRTQTLHRLDRVTRKQELLHFVEQPRRRNVLHQRREIRNRRRGLGIDCHTELRSEPHGAEHAHRIFAEPGNGRADQPQPPKVDIGDAADVIPNRLGRRIEIERVDREIAAHGVLGLRAVDIVGDEPTVLVGRIVAGLRGAKGRHLDRLGSDVHVDEPEAAPMMKARRKSGFTCSGRASVATSKSLGSIPSSRSRTAPPTMNALNPASCSLRVTSSAPRLNCVRRMGWSAGP
jgi:hypothetical protein